MPEETSIAERLSRVERMLEDITHQLNGGQAVSDRIDKIVIDKLEPIRDTVRDNKARIGGLEAARNWSVGGVVAVLGTLFAIYTWFANESSESTKSILRTEMEQKVNVARAVLGEKFAALEKEFADVDGKFNSNTQLRNVQFSEQARLDHMMWNALRDSGAKLPEFPQGPFYQPTGPGG